MRALQFSDYKICMPDLFDRLRGVVRAEINHLRRGGSDPSPRASTRRADREGKGVDATMPRRAPAVVDVDGALRVLELVGSPSLAEVRGQYRALAHRYHPKTRSSVADEAHAARVVLDALTDALELLEEHHLPVAS